MKIIAIVAGTLFVVFCALIAREMEKHDARRIRRLNDEDDTQ